jgi:hypothetical protein
MKNLLLLAGVCLALIATVANTAQAGASGVGCRAPIIISN